MVIAALSIYLGVAPALSVVQGSSRLAAASQESAPLRVIKARRGTDLRQSLKPTDKQLVVEYDGPPPMQVLEPPRGMTAVQWRVSLVPLVAIVNVVDVVSTETSTRDWIQTEVQANVLEVLKNTSPHSLEAGATVSWIEPGGEISLDGRRVTARVPWARPATKNKGYLVFCSFDENGKLITGPLDAYEITGNDLKSQVIRRKPEPLEILTKDAVLSE